MPGDVEIGGFRLEHKLGEGAWSVVYSAWFGDQHCAVKIARSRGGIARWFRREAAALARVRHPGVPVVLDVGEVDGRPYVVMEIVEGETLAHELARGRLGEVETASLGLSLVRICEAIHARGLVHRDIKPRNILRTPTGGIKLVDFGLVTEARPPVSSLPAGTRSYAAPEQWTAPHMVDGRADLFAIGKVLLEAALAPSPELRLVVDRLVAERAVDRYPTASAAAEDFERVLAGELPRLDDGREPADEDAFSLPLIGRRAELQTLAQAWAQAANGHGRAILIEGGAGSGKTRLLRSLTRELRRSEGAWELSSEGSGSVPLAALKRLFDVHVEKLGRLGPDERTAAIDAVRQAASRPTAGLIGSFCPEMAALLGVAPVRESDHEAFVEAIAEYLVRLSQSLGSLLLSVDDFQWVDPVSREVFVRAAAGAARAPLLFVAAARLGERGMPPVARLTAVVATAQLTNIELRPLGERDIARIVASYLGTADPDPALVERISNLADGTPLGAIENLGALLDAGALKPSWGKWCFDAAVAERAPLPRGATALLARRLDDLPPASMRVMEVAAILGNHFRAEHVADTSGVSVETLGFAFAEARRGGVLEQLADGSFHFVHENVRETIVSGLSPEARRELHQAAAEALSNQDSSATTIFAMANHFALGDPTRDPKRVLDVATEAAEQATFALDHETALPFLSLAQVAATHAGITLGVDHHCAVAEAQLRLGALEASLVAFQSALDIAEGTKRAAILGRIAWVHQMMADPAKAWETLASAFSALGDRLPEESPAALVPNVVSSARATVARWLSMPLSEDEKVRLETLCALHYQSARLGIEYEKPARTIASALSILALGERLGPCSKLALSYGSCAGILTALGRREAGASYIARAHLMAKQLEDTATMAQVIQHAVVTAGFAGDFDRTLVLSRECIDDFGPWVEVSEFCISVQTPVAIEMVRGRHRAAWPWLVRAIERVKRHREFPAAYRQMLVPSIIATLDVLGRGDEVEAQIGDVPQHVTSRGFYGILSWGSRAVPFAEGSADLSKLQDFEDDFREAKLNPRTAHPMVMPYYVSMGHAWSRACTEWSAPKRAIALAGFDRALADLRKAARLPLFLAHLKVLEGERAYFANDDAKALSFFAEAEALALRETAPWVQSCVARGQARILRREGKNAAAEDKARVAALLAREHGAIARWQSIAQEFSLPLASVDPTRVDSSAMSMRVHQLRALLDVMRAAAKEPRLAQQTVNVLDEILRLLGAERGMLVFDRESVRVVTGRTHDGRPFGDGEEQALGILARVRSRGRALAVVSDETFEEPRLLSKGRWLAMALYNYDACVGAVYVERAITSPPFRRHAEDLLAVLGPQVAMALELAHVLEERDALNDRLKHAQKMEAVGQLASGIAHDFNNMLTAILSSVEHLEEESATDEDRRFDIRIIQEATRRAADLTEKLLTFARRRLLSVAEVDVNEMIDGILPLLARLLGEHISIVLEREEISGVIKTERSSLEQAIVNLAVNARDAMNAGGTLTIKTREVWLDESGIERGLPQAGRYVEVSVSDTGTGMTSEVKSRVFEPFFTTKRPGSGTGLGLASVYGFVRQTGGHIELSSELGEGTTFVMYFPLLELRATIPVAAAPRRALGRAASAILIVEDEALVRQSVGRVLEREGLRVHTASNAVEALDILRAHEDIDLVVTDVVMPIMTGPELERRLRETGSRIRVLYMSGHTFTELEERGLLSGDVPFIQKPFADAELAHQVKALVLPLTAMDSQIVEPA